MHASLEGTGDLGSVLRRIDAFGYDWIQTHAISSPPPLSEQEEEEDRGHHCTENQREEECRGDEDEDDVPGTSVRCGGDGACCDLLDALEDLLRYRVPSSSSSSSAAAAAAACVHFWEGCPLSLARVRLNRKALGPLRYNLFKRVMDRGVRWRPAVVYFFENHDDKEETQERYRYFLQHTLRDCKTVRIPAHWSLEDKARAVVEDARMSFR